MYKAVFVNVKKINYDKKLDFSSIEKLATLAKYDDSNNDEFLERIQSHDIVITKELPVSRELINQFPPSVKMICEAGTGYNNIDLKAAKEKGIIVSNVPGYSSEAVAQLVINFILNLSSSMIRHHLMLKDNNFDNFTKYYQLPHVEVQNKTLGLVGAGGIGQSVIKIARALGMKILVNTRSPRQWDDPHIKNASLEELLQNSDFVSLHCPLTSETKHLINKEKLGLMKPTAFIINTSRGSIIKEADLIEALKNNVIAGAALDVQEVEPPALDNPLFTMPNVIITPHIGWQCLESRQRLVDLTAQNIAAFIQGTPINVVN